MRDGGAYGCAVPRAYANLNPGLHNNRMSTGSLCHLIIIHVVQFYTNLILLLVVICNPDVGHVPVITTSAAGGF